MNRSSRTNSDGRGGTISGVTVVFGLVLLVFAGAGFAVAMYLALGPFSLRRHAAAEMAAESIRQTSSPAATDEPLAATRTGDVPAATDDPSAGGSRLSAGPKAMPQELNGRTSSPLAAGTEADVSLAAARVSEPPGVFLTALSPLEIVGIGGNAGDWRGSLKIDGQVYEHAVLLQPAEGESGTQIAFALKAGFTRFAGFVAIIAGDAPAAVANRDQPQAIFRLYGDGNLVWESAPLTGHGTRREFECEVRGVEVLTLVAESPTPANVSRFAWGDLSLLPAEKTAVPAKEHR